MPTIVAVVILVAMVIGACGPEQPLASSQTESASSTQTEVKKQGPALWTINKERGRIWFFGSVHVLPRGETWLTPELAAAIDGADAVVLEIPFKEAQSLAMQVYVMQNAFSLSQPALSSQGSEKQRQALAKAAATAGLEPYQIDQMRPWFASITLTMSLLTKSGYDPNNGVDQFINREAQARKKEMLYFESARQQIDFFINLPEEVQGEMLRDTVDEINESPDMVDKMVAAWRAGDLGNLAKLANDSYTCPELEKILLTDRNARWVEKIKTWLDDPKSYLVVVGAGHLVGEDSVIDMLRDDGVEIDGP